MCIIAMKPEGVTLSDAKLYHMWKNNPDGAGFMYAEDGKLKIVKGLMTYMHFRQALDEAGPTRKIVMHFRIRTHGAIKPEMTHPFWINNNLGMAHNGVITKLAGETTTLRSDTAVFAAKLANEYSNPLDAIKNPFHRAMIESFIGYSKLVFMDATGKHYIFNENMGTWDKDVWYSNESYKPAKIAANKSAWKDEKKNLSDKVISGWVQPDQRADWQALYRGDDVEYMRPSGRFSGSPSTSSRRGSNEPIVRHEMREGKMVEVKVYPSSGRGRGRR